MLNVNVINKESFALCISITRHSDTGQNYTNVDDTHTLEHFNLINYYDQTKVKYKRDKIVKLHDFITVLTSCVLSGSSRPKTEPLKYKYSRTEETNKTPKSSINIKKMSGIRQYDGNQQNKFIRHNYIQQL